MKTKISILLAVILAAAVMITGCGSKNAQPEKAGGTVAATADEAKTDASTEVTEQALPTSAAPDDDTDNSTEQETINLLLDESEFINIKLDPNIDWENLYYEQLRALDDTIYTKCALVYINDDDIPELLVLSEATVNKYYYFYVNEDGLSLASYCSDGFEDYWYLERQNKYVVKRIYKYKPYPTYKDESLNRDITLKFFSGADTDYLNSKELDENIDKDSTDDLKSEENLSVKNYFSAIKEYFDIDQAKTPDFIPIGNMIEQMKSQRKDPDIKAEWYKGRDIYYLVSTYKDVTNTIDYYDEKLTLSYRIPQINIDGGDVQKINQEILDEFSKDADNISKITKIPFDDGEENIQPRYKNLYYNVYGQNGVLSLVIDAKGFGGTDSPSDRFVYTIEISSGKLISNICLLNSYDVDCQTVAGIFEKQIKQYYDSLKNDPDSIINKSDSYDYSICDEYCNWAIENFSPVGEQNQMFFDDNGNLNIQYRCIAFAGPLYEQKTMTISSEYLE